MDVPGDRTPKAQKDDDKSKAVETDNANNNMKEDKTGAEESPQPTKPAPAENS